MDWKKFLLHKKTIWIGLGVFALILRLSLSPQFIENWYSRGLFLGIRRIIDLVTGIFPVALVYPVVLLLFVLLGSAIYKFFRKPLSWKKKIVQALTSILAFAGAVVFLFLFMWGYNYGRVPLENKIGIQPQPLNVDELRAELEAATTEVLTLRDQLPGASDTTLSSTLLPNNLETTMRQELLDVLNGFEYPTPGKVRGRIIKPKGILLRISTAGVYIPFTGEGHIDAGLHHLQLPFVVAHEMSHGYGFGDEGTCNFLAYLACTQSEDPYLRYVGHLYYWRYVAGDYRAFQPEEYKTFREALPPGLKADLRAISLEMAKYPDIFPKIRDATYNAYLRAQGIEEGMKNYDRVVMLVKAWRDAQGH